jgi:dTDP-4-dehydrorhamnose 3,5-epimerase
LRGLYYQLPPFVQAKLIRCAVGEIFDVVVDIRKSSPTFGRWVGVHLFAENKRQFWIPEGFAYGIMVLSDVAEFLYKTNNYYSPGLRVRSFEAILISVLSSRQTLNHHYPAKMSLLLVLKT